MLSGAGEAGVGEDVSYAPADHEAFQAAGPVLSLAGRYTLGSFAERLDELELFPVSPQRADARPHRRWAFESAALDLALRQSGLSLAAALDRQPEPVSFVVSMRLPEPPSAEPVLRRLELYPDLRFKLDVSASWNEELVRELAATRAITSVDFKAYYEGLTLTTASGPELYRLVAEGLPDVWLEDPALTAETRRVLEPHMGRITWDAPIGSVEELAALRVRPQYVNVKPSRFGTLRALLDAYDYLADEGIRATAGASSSSVPGAARSSTSRRCSIPTRRTTWRRSDSTRSTPACRTARWRRGRRPSGSVGGRLRLTLVDLSGSLVSASQRRSLM